MAKVRCWGFRIATGHIEYLAEELEHGRLRQGWGYDQGQNLRNLTFDAGARRNLRMLNVRKGDLLLVPRLPVWNLVAIVEATEDWSSGYKFAIDPAIGDLGHIFPAKFVTSFARDNEHVAGDIRATLRNPSRFWNIDHLDADIRRLCETGGDLGLSKTPLEKARDIAASVFHDVLATGAFRNKVFERLNQRLEGKDWERVLQAVMTMRYPTGIVEVVQGTSEAHHGTDILVRLPDITGESRYAIAIQVKDHMGTVDTAAVEQISKADYWNEQHGLVLIQRVVVFTRATRADNANLAKLEQKTGVQIVFGDALQNILDEWARHQAATTLL